MTYTVAPTQLVARWRRLDHDVDLVAFGGDDGVVFERDGVGLAGRGVALRVRLPDGLADPDAATRVSDALGAIQRDETGVAPVALGALPFDRHAPAELVVPELLVRRDADGACTLLTVGSRRHADRLPMPLSSSTDSPDGFTLSSPVGHREWCRLVDDAVATIRTGELAKVVLAREVSVEANRPLVTHEVVARLRSLYPSCTVFSLDGFVGASPELLIERRAGHVRSHPMAGTIARSGDPEADGRAAAALLTSAKDTEEHRLVVDAVAAVLAPACRELDVPGSPSIVSLRNVSHLGTLLRGRLHEPAPSALELAARLHPTPAVGGTPTDAALAWLARAEGFERGRYAGPVGWVDADGDGTWVVGIRSAELDGRRARLFAGVGVVEGSVAEEELAETQFKLQALLAAVVRP